MDVILVTGEYVSKKSRPSFYLNPLATNLALYLSIEPLDFNFFLKIYLHHSGKIPEVKSTISQV